MKGSEIISLKNIFSQSLSVHYDTRTSNYDSIDPDKTYEVEYSSSDGYYWNDEEYNVIRAID